MAKTHTRRNDEDSSDDKLLFWNDGPSKRSVYQSQQPHLQHRANHGHEIHPPAIHPRDRTTSAISRVPPPVPRLRPTLDNHDGPETPNPGVRDDSVRV